MKYYRHVTEAVLLRVGDGHYDVLTWGSPRWWHEGTDPWRLNSRDRYVEITEAEAEVFVEDALRAERADEERVFAEELGFEDFYDLMECSEEALVLDDGTHVYVTCLSDMWSAWNYDVLDPDGAVFAKTKEEAIEMAKKKFTD